MLDVHHERFLSQLLMRWTEVLASEDRTFSEDPYFMCFLMRTAALRLVYQLVVLLCLVGAHKHPLLLVETCIESQNY